MALIEIRRNSLGLTSQTFNNLILVRQELQDVKNDIHLIFDNV